MTVKDRPKAVVTVEDSFVPPHAPPVKPWRVSLWNHLSLQSKLLVMLLSVSIFSILITGYIGYHSGTQALTEFAFERLSALRQARAGQVERYFGQLRAQVLSYSESTMFVAAMAEFRQDYRALDKTSLSDQQQQQLRAFYQNTFLPTLANNLETPPAIEGYLPTTNAQRYLQYHYSIASSDFTKLAAVDDNGDGSAYSATHLRYHPLFRNITTRFDFDDMLLIDVESANVVYSVSKGVELGSNLDTGPYANSSLGRAFRSARDSGDLNDVVFTDFESYRPWYGKPTAFVLSPIFDGARMIGVLAFQFPIEAINTIITDDDHWERDGLGKTGEIYLAGSDYLLRSQSRFLVQDPAAYERDMLAAGMNQADVELAVRMRSAILLQPARTDMVEMALHNQQGTIITTDYRNQQVLASYSPVRLPSLNWVIVAKLDTAEAFAPAQRFAQLVAITTVGLIVPMVIIGIFLSRLLTRPIQHLTAAANQIGSGQFDVEIPIGLNDEIGELGRSFNAMARSLKVKADLIEQQQQENERILSSVMPEALIQRYRGGEEIIAEDYQNVTVLVADVAGFSDYAATLPAIQSGTLINKLVLAFDQAAERYGVEKVKTVGASYLAACGLSTPRIDHARRVVEFAREMGRIVERFNREVGMELHLHVGVESGAAKAGLVGKNKFVYDLWGDAVNIAHQAQPSNGHDSVVVTDTVRSRLEGTMTFEAAGTVTTKSGSVTTLWALRDKE